jgi:nitrogen fixation NifU-like protein
MAINDLEDLYREIVLDHYRSPRNRGELPSPPAHRATGFNPLCGDEISLDVIVEDGKIKEVAFSGQGCSISQSSASLMTSAIKGKPVEEARKLTRSFKAMMNIHQSSLGKDGEDLAESEEGPEEADASEQVDPKDLGELAALQGVVKYPVRIKCATLSWNTLLQALDEIEGKKE